MTSFKFIIASSLIVLKHINPATQKSEYAHSQSHNVLRGSDCTCSTQVVYLQLYLSVSFTKIPSYFIWFEKVLKFFLFIYKLNANGFYESVL